jgi:hypothetical protein
MFDCVAAMSGLKLDKIIPKLNAYPIRQKRSEITIINA